MMFSICLHNVDFTQACPSTNKEVSALPIGEPVSFGQPKCFPYRRLHDHINLPLGIRNSAVFSHAVSLTVATSRVTERNLRHAGQPDSAVSAHRSNPTVLVYRRQNTRGQNGALQIHEARKRHGTQLQIQAFISGRGRG